MDNCFYTYVWYVTSAGQSTPIYVGKGYGDRKTAHLTKSHNDEISALLKNHQHFHIWMDAETESEALDREIEWIAKFGRKDLGTGTLLNRTKGGQGLGGHNHGAEARKKMADAKAGIPRAVITCPHCNKTGADNVMKRWHFIKCPSNPNRSVDNRKLGPRSEETRAKISATMKKR